MKMPDPRKRKRLPRPRRVVMQLPLRHQQSVRINRWWRDSIKSKKTNSLNTKKSTNN